MKIFGYIFVFVAVWQWMVAEADDLCAIAYQHCGFDNVTPMIKNRVGKAGPRGPPGPPTDVNYTKINEKILKQIEEAESRLDTKIGKYEKMIKEIQAQTKGYILPESCNQVKKLTEGTWVGSGGIFRIFPNWYKDNIELYCDLKTDGGGWTVFQRRMDGSVDFQRNWTTYVDGFGDKDKEFWLGLENIYQLTKDGTYELRVDMADWDGKTAYAKYGTFSIGDASTKYRLSVGGYSGTAGDSLVYSLGQSFTTIDSDNDKHAAVNCASLYKGAWWHKECHHANLNGLYVEGGKAPFGVALNWYHWKGHEYSVKFSEMKFRNKN